MENAEATLLLTRPEPQSLAFLADCEAALGRQIASVISPLIGIEPVGEVPDMDSFETIAVTSGNAVRHLGDRLAGRRVVTVGAKTAELAREAGAAAVCLGESVAEFLENTGEVQGPVLHARGVHTRGDVVGGLRNLGINAEEAVIYDQVALPLSDEAKALLGGEMRVIAPLFSPRTADLLSREEILAPVTVIAMSEAVHKAWRREGDVRLADFPTAEAMKRAVAEAF